VLLLLLLAAGAAAATARADGLPVLGVDVGTEACERGELVTLAGDFSFDAISPGGLLLYLVHYLSADDPTSHEVRVYDLVRGRLLREPVVDPGEAEEMRGSPITRGGSPSRRTDGAGGGAEGPGAGRGARAAAGRRCGGGALRPGPRVVVGAALQAAS
jgi:hypothetical protein